MGVADAIPPGESPGTAVVPEELFLDGIVFAYCAGGVRSRWGAWGSWGESGRGSDAPIGVKWCGSVVVGC